jgi:hypothetical protein
MQASNNEPLKIGTGVCTNELNLLNMNIHFLVFQEYVGGKRDSH